MNAKKILCLLFALLALTLVLSVSIFAEEETEPTVYEFNDINSFKAAINSAQAGDIIRMTANTTVTQLNDTGAASATVPTNKAVIIDLNGFTLTTTGSYGGAYIGGGASIINGTIKHTGNTCAIKACNLDRVEDLTIIVESPKSDTGGISMRNHAGSGNYAHINVMKNVNMIGTGNYGIETYGQGEGVDKTLPVIDLIENCEIDSMKYGLDLSCSIGTIKDCVISGSQAGISCKTSNGFAIALNFEGDNDIMGGNCAVYLQTGVTITADKYTDFVNVNGGDVFSASTTNVNNSTLDIVGFTAQNGVMVECAHEVVGGSCTERAECSVCGKAFDYVHNFVEDESKRELPNCTVQGKAYYNCECGATSEAFIPRDPNAHEWVVTTKDATHTEAGSITYNCKYGSCVGEEIVEEIAIIPHSYEAVVTDPTCTKDGYTTYTCSCGDFYTEPGEAATGHNYVGGEEVNGETVYTCTNCGDSYSCVHEFVETRVEPTEEADGYIKNTCSKCGETNEVILPKLVVYYVSNVSEFYTAYKACTGGEIIRFTDDVAIQQFNGDNRQPSSTSYLAKDVTIDLGGHTMTTSSNWGGVLLGNDVSFINGTLIHRGKTCAIKVFGAVDKIENLTIILENTAEDLMLGGIVLQTTNNNTRKISVNSIKNVTITGEDLSNGIETYNCGNQVNENGEFIPVIGGIENVTINSREYGMWISANVGDIKNCTIHGDLAGIKFEGKGTGWAASANLINSTVDGNNAAVTVVYSGGNFSVTGDKYSTFTSESGVMFENAPVASDNVTFDMVGVTVNEDGTLTFCPHENVTLGDCDTESECIDCTKVLGFVHTFEETSRVDSTCTVAGTVYYACACGATKEETLPYADHSYDNIVVTAPTCTTVGYTTYTCVCGDTYKENEVEALGHTVGTAATCTEAAICETCGKSFGEANGHNYESFITLYPTCIQNGVETFTCSVCNDQYTKEVVADLEDESVHNYWPDWETKKDATCIEGGYEKLTCQNCGKVVEKTSEPDTEYGHSWEVNMETYKDATCIEDGYRERICLLCGAEDTAVLDKSIYGSHDYVVDFETYKEATCNEDGYAKYTCSVCGDSYEDTTPASPWAHVYEYSANGVFQECSVCGEFSLRDTFEGGNEEAVVDYSVYFMGSDILNIYYTTDYMVLDEYYYYTITKNEDGTYTLTIGECYNGADTFKLANTTATFEIKENGGVLTLTNADGAVYTFDNLVETPDEDPNALLNGTYAYLDMGGNANLMFKFEDGVVYVLVDKMGLGLPESFAYNYNPAMGMIITEEIGNFFSISDGTLYAGMGWMLTPVEDEEPEEPTPEVNYGDAIGSITVETTDTYTFDVDIYTYTADKAGQYSFYVPAGLSFFSNKAAQPEIDFNLNPEGGYVVLQLEAGEEITFAIMAATKQEWSIDVYYLAPEVSCEHEWVDATCTAPKTCTLCGETEGEALGHTEVEIPEVRPTPSTQGYTAGIKCSKCGEIIKAQKAIEVKATGDSTFRINNATLGISESINMIYRVTLPAGYEDAYLVFTFNGEEHIVDVSAGLTPGYENRYNYIFSGVTPQYMGRTVTANLYAKVGDDYIAGAKVIEYSVRQYCQTQLENASISAEIKTLLSDFLVYGAKAQILMGVDTDALVTAGLNIEPSAFEALTSEDSVQALTGTKDSKTDFANASLSLGSSVSMLIKFYADENPETVWMKVSINGREQIIHATDCNTEIYNGRTRYIAEFTNITAIEFGDVVTAELYKDGVQVGRTLTYSVNSYIYSAQSSTSGDLLDLIKALYNYGKSAAATVGK